MDIHDGHTAYDTLARKTGNRSQHRCWAHFICGAKELAKFTGEEGRVIRRILKKTYKRAMAFDHKGTEADVEQFIYHLKGDLDRRYKSSKCTTFVKNLLAKKDQLFVFVTNPDVDATNNAAEQAIRPGVIMRKISGGCRSANGAEVPQTLMSVCQTFRVQKKELLVHGPAILSTSHG